MASAGRILIMPKGNYDPNVEYEMLDMVFHNGTSWVAKKMAGGIVPSEENSEYWHKMTDNFIPTPEEIGAIPQSAFIGLKDESLDKSYTNIDTLPDGVYSYNGWSYDSIECSVNLPFTNAMGIWIKKSRYNSTDTIARQDIAINVNTGAMYTMDAYDGVWKEKYLSLSGGTLTGDLKMSKSKPRLQFKNTDNSRFVIVEAGEDGYSSLGNWKSEDDQANLQVRKPEDGIEEIVRLTVNGEESYRMFGEHNISLLKNYVNEMIAEYFKNN